MFSYVTSNAFIDPTITFVINYLRNELDQLEINRENFGLIHFDYELDNILFDNNVIGVLDFDDCGYFWYVCDIIYALRYYMDDFQLPISKKVNIFLENYQSQTSFDYKVFEKRDLLICLHNLYFYGRLSRAIDIIEDESNPDWMNNIVKKLTSGIHELKQFFIVFETSHR